MIFYGKRNWNGIDDDRDIKQRYYTIYVMDLSNFQFKVGLIVNNNFINILIQI